MNKLQKSIEKRKKTIQRRIKNGKVYKTQLKGKDNQKWKGNKFVYDEIRFSDKSIEWKNFILNRDNHTCVICGFKYKEYTISDKGKYPLNVDHIISFAKIMEKMKFELGVLNIFENAMSYELLWDTSNGRTLCIPCHKLTDTFGHG